MSLDAVLQRIWYHNSPLKWLLLPLSTLFGVLAWLRRAAYKSGLLRAERVSRPVVVIGNITVGGTGKTPLVVWLANQLHQQGNRVAVITRGYGGEASGWPQWVHADSDARLVGDESVVIARQTAAQVMAGPDRVAAARRAIELGAEVIISDDGLQHYRLARDVEIAVVDASRLLGNGWLLPAGPLREPGSRLQRVDLVALNQREPALQADWLADWPGGIEFKVTLGEARNLATGESVPLRRFAGQGLHLVTGIGNPQALIAMLRSCGMQVDARLLRDHAVLRAADIEFNDALPVLMTEKDAVKCHAFADGRHWAIAAEVVMPPQSAQTLLDCVNQAIARHSSTLH